MEVFRSDTDDIQQGYRTGLTPHLYYPMVAKVFERIIYDQVFGFLMDNYFLS